MGSASLVSLLAESKRPSHRPAPKACDKVRAYGTASPSLALVSMEVILSYRLGILTVAAFLFAIAVAACSDSDGDAVVVAPTAVTEVQAAATEVPEPAASEETMAEEMAAEEAVGPVFEDTVMAPEGQRTTEVLNNIPVALHLDQKVASPSLVSGLSVFFLAVIEDSRCPTGAECITPGTVTIRVDTASGSLPTGETTLVLEVGQVGPTIKKLGKFSVVFLAMEPYPVAGETIDLADYVATLAVIVE